jgi:hypothetical protein
MIWHWWQSPSTLSCNNQVSITHWIASPVVFWTTFASWPQLWAMEVSSYDLQVTVVHLKCHIHQNLEFSYNWKQRIANTWESAKASPLSAKIWRPMILLRSRMRLLSACDRPSSGSLTAGKGALVRLLSTKERRNPERTCCGGAAFTNENKQRNLNGHTKWDRATSRKTGSKQAIKTHWIFSLSECPKAQLLRNI